MILHFHALIIWKIMILKFCSSSKCCHISLYSWPLNNAGVGALTLQAVSTYTFDSPKNLTTYSLLFTGSLTNNIQSIDTYFVCYRYLCCSLIIKWVREKKILFKSSQTSKKNSNLFTEKHPCISGPAQFKHVLFKGQL